MTYIELFSAGCPLCQEVAKKIESLTGPGCSVRVHDLRDDPAVRKAAEQYGIRRVPSVVIDGRLAACCTGSAVEEAVLRAAGLGACQP
ncbi:MAG TPA: glutaredoxin domain-containing protein [Bryobacteraceae bacterium]|nr:glutaredoxin domain-containing protein [Bryobacteraceae bacterium]